MQQNYKFLCFTYWAVFFYQKQNKKFTLMESSFFFFFNYILSGEETLKPFSIENTKKINKSIDLKITGHYFIFNKWINIFSFNITRVTLQSNFGQIHVTRGLSLNYTAELLDQIQPINNFTQPILRTTTWLIFQFKLYYRYLLVPP